MLGGGDLNVFRVLDAVDCDDCIFPAKAALDESKNTSEGEV